MDDLEVKSHIDIMDSWIAYFLDPESDEHTAQVIEEYYEIEVR